MTLAPTPRRAALGAVTLALTVILSGCGGSKAPAPTLVSPTPVVGAATTGPFVARPTEGVRPPAAAPEAPALERYGAEPAEAAYPVSIPAREHWPAPTVDSPGESFLVSPAREDKGSRRIMSRDEVAFVAMRDLFTWDASVHTTEALAERMSTWFVEEADPIVAEEVSTRWAAFKEKGTSSRLQSYRDASEWGTPSDTREVSYRAAEVTVRLTDADGTERVEQWIAFITMTTAGKSPSSGAKMIMSYRLALS
ncbi:hypothetical protein ACTVBU_10930 [Sanguibacter sp. A246]|uniref:hypothetical protein n=1 Tax=Sanguibacter sp. A246 TaxID=3457326 RepID=UPI003FD6CDE1